MDEEPVETTPPFKPAPAPRWVKVVITIVVALLILAIVFFASTGGNHGPGRHLSAPFGRSPITA